MGRRQSRDCDVREVGAGYPRRAPDPVREEGRFPSGSWLSNAAGAGLLLTSSVSIIAGRAATRC